MVEGTIVELEVGDQASFLIGTIRFHKGAFVRKLVNKAALVEVSI
jgi:hypothetical protein